KTLKVHRELGGGMLQILALPLPALLTVQLGIFKLRYASLRGIAKARQKEMKQITTGDLQLSPEELKKQPAKQKVLELSFPPKTKKAQILEGKPDEIAKVLLEKLRTEAKVV
ncbi:MAG: electron transfer flavoprotein subunit beta, partial [Candidatus Bathyarchaeia archaeon]